MNNGEPRPENECGRHMSIDYDTMCYPFGREYRPVFRRQTINFYEIGEDIPDETCYDAGQPHKIEINQNET